MMQSSSAQYLSKPVKAMFLPLQMDGMLLPDVSVVEVMQVREIAEASGSPEWYIGSIAWRGIQLPLICFESLNGAMTVPAESVESVAIVRGTADHGHLPYYALVICGKPQLFTLSDEDIEVHEGRPRGRAEAMSVAVLDQTAGIPNIEWVEQHLLAYTLHS